MNKLLSLVTMLSTHGTDWDKEWQWLGKLIDFVNSAIPFILVAVGTFGVIYSIVLGVNMAKAEDASKREEAKKRIINFVIAIVITIVLILVMKLVMDNLENWGLGFKTTTPSTPSTPSTGSGGSGGGNSIENSLGNKDITTTLK